jgi:hypothetical protein
MDRNGGGSGECGGRVKGDLAGHGVERVDTIGSRDGDLLAIVWEEWADRCGGTETETGDVQRRCTVSTIVDGGFVVLNNIETIGDGIRTSGRPTDDDCDIRRRN